MNKKKRKKKTPPPKFTASFFSELILPHPDFPVPMSSTNPGEGLVKTNSHLNALSDLRVRLKIKLCTIHIFQDFQVSNVRIDVLNSRHII